EGSMATTTFDMNDLRRRMRGAIGALKQEMSGLRTGRASTALLDHVQVEAYGTHMPLNQLATISVPEPRLLNVQVWDRSMVHAVEKAISAANLGLTPSTEGQVLRLRIPELNEERRREIVKVAHKYAEAARVAVRHVRRDGLDLLKKLEKDHKISEDEHNRQHDEVQKVPHVDKGAEQGTSDEKAFVGATATAITTGVTSTERRSVGARLTSPIVVGPPGRGVSPATSPAVGAAPRGRECRHGAGLTA